MIDANWVEDWTVRAEEAGRVKMDIETGEHSITIPMNLWRELVGMFAENQDPKAMGWVGSDGSP
jgi:hypothetical protein